MAQPTIMLIVDPDNRTVCADAFTSRRVSERIIFPSLARILCA
jgi:hypothetical protein